jgi:amino acid transporter
MCLRLALRPGLANCHHIFRRRSWWSNPRPHNRQERILCPSATAWRITHHRGSKLLHHFQHFSCAQMPRKKPSEVFGSSRITLGGAVWVCLLGSDAATHMSEELQDASKTLPKAMIWMAAVNSCLGFLMLTTSCFCHGDVERVISTATGQPHIQIMYNATQSTAGATVLDSITIFIMAVVRCVNNVATGSRQLFALVSDQGDPFGG